MTTAPRALSLRVDSPLSAPGAGMPKGSGGIFSDAPSSSDDTETSGNAERQGATMGPSFMSRTERMRRIWPLRDERSKGGCDVDDEGGCLGTEDFFDGGMMEQVEVWLGYRGGGEGWGKAGRLI